MTQIIVSLITAQGDELGRLRLTDVNIAEAGKSSAAARPNLSGQMAQLLSQLSAALTHESMLPTGNSASVKIAVARALMHPSPEDGTATIALPVRFADDARPAAGSPPPPANLQPSMNNASAEWQGDFIQDTSDPENDLDSLFALDEDVPLAVPYTPAQKGTGQPAAPSFGEASMSEWDDFGSDLD